MKVRILYSILISALFYSCQTDVYYRTKTGLLYKIVSSNKRDSVARMGNTVKINYVQRVGDRVIESSYGKMPTYYMVLPGMSPYNPLEAFDYGLRKGDSVETIQLVDSMLKKKIFLKMPPWMKKSDKWITTFKVEDVFVSDSLLQLDRQKEMQRVMKDQTIGGIKRIEKYLVDKKLSARKNGDVFIEVLKGNQTDSADTSKTMRLDFVLKTLQGKILNSTRDTSFHLKGPVAFPVGSGFMPPVVENVLKHLSAESEARIYVPGVLVFGVNPHSKEIKIDDDLVFEIEKDDTNH